jgi:hypothetical protein
MASKTGNLKSFIKTIPILGKAILTLKRRIKGEYFPGSAKYWNLLYKSGGNSGAGSYGRLALFKAEIINRFVVDHKIHSVMEFGCGDGNQLSFSEYPSYTGFDISSLIIKTCKGLYINDMTKSFFTMDEYKGQTAELCLSLDVIFHLVEYDVFEAYMKRLFLASDQFVIIYSSDYNTPDDMPLCHEKHRKFTEWVSVNVQGWTLIEHIPNRYPYRNDQNEESVADFFIYRKDTI